MLLLFALFVLLEVWILLNLTIWPDYFERPVIVLDEQGIHFLQNPKKPFSIDWLSIDGMAEVRGRRYHYIVLKMKDRQTFLRRFSILKRLGIVLDNFLGMTNGECYVSLAGTKGMSYSKLLSLMKDYHRNARQSMEK